jgi:hypothetical protein
MRTETVTQAMQVCLGEQAIAVGTLTYSRQGARENTLFVYDDAWLENDNRFEISPDLPLTRERYFHKAATRSDGLHIPAAKSLYQVLFRLDRGHNKISWCIFAIATLSLS